MRPRRPVRLAKAGKDNENTFQYSCVAQLKARALPGVWWHHSPNECIRDNAQAVHQSRMGCMFGFWDLVIFKPFGFFDTMIDVPHWFELKHGEGVLSDNEQKFRGMLFERKAKHKVVRDIDTFINQCIKWELIK